MEKLIYRALCLFVVAGMFWLAGCEDETRIIVERPAPGSPASVQIVMSDCTLTMNEGDSTSALVIVVVRDLEELLVPDVRVALTLQNPALGYLEFVDIVRRDTTNDQGQVLLNYRSYGVEGNDTLRAQAGGVRATLPFTLRYTEPREDRWHVYIIGLEDSLTLYPHDTVDAYIGVLVTNQYHGAVPGVCVELSLSNPQLGYLTFGDPVRRDSTDEFGLVHARYVNWAGGCNVISAAVEGYADSEEVCTRAVQTASLEIQVYDTSLVFVQGDTAVSALSITALDEYGEPVRNQDISMQLSRPDLGWLILSGPDGFYRTNWYGDLYLVYFTAAEGCNVISASTGEVNTSTEVCAEEQIFYEPHFDIAEDTLYFFAGDTASTRMVFSVVDGLGFPVPGLAVHVSFAAAPFDSHLDLVHPDQGEVTDEFGRVDYVFWTTNAGPATWRLVFQEIGTQGTIYIRQYDPSVGLLAIPGSIHFPTQGDSVLLELNLWELLFPSHAIRDSVLAVWISGGELDQNPLPPTDNEGRAWTWWHFNQTPGTYRAAVNYHGYTDSVTVQVTQ